MDRNGKLISKGNSASKPCFAFQNGDCTKGKHCKFSHSIPKGGGQKGGGKDGGKQTPHKGGRGKGGRGKHKW